MRLLIVSHTPHYQHGSAIQGWGPTIRELDHLASLFAEVVHLAPLHPGPAPASSLAYTAKNIQLHPVAPAGGEHMLEKLRIGAVLPAYARAIVQELHTSDVVHVRCPANISLTALIILCMRKQPVYRWIKYAGNWSPSGKEARSYRLQRLILSKNWVRGSVTINGRWPRQPEHITSFYNPSLAETEWTEARAMAARKPAFPPIRCLFVGRLEDAKGVMTALQVVKILRDQGLPILLELAGDGPQREAYESYVRESNIREHVAFLGWVPKPDLKNYYARAHFIILPSASEGWPKVLSEGMAYGAVPVASSVSAIPQILAETGAGLAVGSHTPQAYADAVLRFVHQPDAWRAASSAGIEASCRFTYSYYLGQVQRLFQQSGLRLGLGHG